MGQLENVNFQKVRKTRLQHAVLATIGGAGILTIGLLAPNVVGALGKLGLVLSPRNKDVIRTSMTRLKNKGLLEFSNGRYRLTDAGTRILRLWEGQDYKIRTPKKWDKKWRVVIFDIPEKKRSTRTRARSILTQAGFKRLQDSVWVHPFDCEDVITLLKTELGISKDMLYMIVDQIENERHLRRDFDLA